MPQSTTTAITKTFDYANWQVCADTPSLLPQTRYEILDLTYGCILGHVRIEDGPGAIFEPAPTAVLDACNITTLHAFIGHLNNGSLAVQIVA